MIRLAAGQRGDAGAEVGQRFERFAGGSIVAGMHQRRGREGDEIDVLDRWSLAVQLGEVGEHAAAERVRKGAA